MIASKNSEKKLRLNSSGRINEVMEQNPLKKTELMSVKGADVK